MNDATNPLHLRPGVDQSSSADDRMLCSDQRLGEILVASGHLAHGDIGYVRQHQRETNLLFGDAAVSLGLVVRDEVIRAIAKQFDFPYLGSEPHGLSAELVVAVAPFSSSAAAFRDLRTRLMLATRCAEPNARPIVVSSARRSDGRSYCAANIAISFSQMGCKTLLLDADLRNPQQHTLFGVANREGLSSMLAGRSLVEAIVPVREIANLHLLPAGGVPPNPQELLSRPTLKHMLDALCQMFDQIIVDVPAAETGTDARMVAARCGSALFVGRKGRSKVLDLESMAQQLTLDGGQCLGVLLNEPP